MDVSTDAILFYGFSYAESQSFPWNAKKFGGNDDVWFLETYHPDIVNSDPELEFDREQENAADKYDEWHDDNRDAIDEYKRRKREALDKRPYTLVRHCSADCSMYGLALSGMVLSAKSGFPMVIPSLPDRDNMILPMFLKFLDDHKLRPAHPTALNWWLCSYWG